MPKSRAEGEAPRKQKKRRTGMPFIEAEAQEDDDYEDEEFDEDEFDPEAELGEEEAEAAATELALKERRMVDSKLGESAGPRLGGTGHFANTVGDLERRYQGLDFDTGEYGGEAGGMHPDGGMGGVEGEYGYDEGDEEGDLMMGYGELEGDMSKILPIGGMKLWKVPVIRPGVERETCIAILKKYANTPDPKKDLFPVGAAYASDTVKGCVYIEAISPLHLIEALRDVRTLMLIRTQIKMVPAREMTDVFATAPISDRVPQRGEWGRIQRGLYAGDVCLISDVIEGTQNCTVRVVPRIDLDYEARAMTMETQSGQKVPLPKTRPNPRLVTSSDLDERKIEAHRFGHNLADCFMFRNHIVEEDTGFALREVKISQLLTGEHAKVKPKDIETFFQGQDPSFLSQQWGLNLSARETGAELFEAGQRIQIARGELAGVTGIVKAVEAGKLIIHPDDRGVADFQVEPSFCLKKFSLGESVKVVAGSHDGDIGLITKIDVIKGTAEVLSTDTHKQITCNLAHLTSVPNDSITPVGLTKIDGYAVGDLVSLAASNQVGVITRLHKSRRIEVLTKEGSVACDVSQLDCKRTLKVAHALDAENNQFGTGATVEVLEGPAARTVGAVKYIWKDTVFIQPLSGSSPTNLVVSESQAVRISRGAEDSKTLDTGMGGPPGGPSAGATGAAGSISMSSAKQSGAPTMNHTGRGGIGFRRQFSLMGRQVKVVGGQHKGMLGELRNVQGPDALVLISALNKEIRLPRQQIELMGGSSSDIRSGADRIFRRSTR